MPRIFGLLLILPITISSQPGAVWSLDTCVKRALTNFAAKDEMRMELVRLSNQRDELQAAWRPSLSYSIQTIDTRQGPRDIFVGSMAFPQPATSYTYHSMSVNVTQRLTDWGRTSQYKANLHIDRQRVKNDYLQLERDLVLEIQGLFLDLAAAQALKQLYALSLADLERQARYLDNLVNQGLRPQQDRYRFQVQLNRTRDAQELENDRIQNLKAELNLRLGRKPNDPLVPDIADPGSEADTTLPRLTLRPIPGHESLRNRLQSAKRELTLLKSERFPSVYLQAGYNRGSERARDVYTDFAQNWSLGTSLSLSIPLTGDPRRHSRILEKDLEIQRLDRLVRDQRERTLNTFVRLQSTFRTERNRLVMIRENDGSLQEIYSFVRHRYESGLESYENLVLARRSLLENQRVYISVSIRLLKTRYHLEILGGKWDDVILRGADIDLKGLRK